VELTGSELTLRQVRRVALGSSDVAITSDASVRARVDGSVLAMQRLIDQRQTIYGVTTGFGGRANVFVDADAAVELQTNLLHFHRAGVGAPLDDADVRAAMTVRANTNLRGASALRWEVIERFARFLNAGVTPVVRRHGSIGASGDLTPLAAIAACIVGLDDFSRVRWQGRELSATGALAALGLRPIVLRPKEALAMMNGTAVSAGMAANSIAEFETIFGGVLAFHALAIQALTGSPEPFDAFLHCQKPHPGQARIAELMRHLLQGSRLTVRHDPAKPADSGRLVQDRYSIRCLPQFLGPVVEAVRTIRTQLEIEINSTSDNPLIDVEHTRAYHGGNFLAQHVATGLDAIRGHVGLIAKHLDAQLALLMAPEFSLGLPASLVGNNARAVNMGLKAAQITANALMPLIIHHGMPIAHLFATHAEQFNQNVNSLAMPAAHLAHAQADLARQHVAIALLASIQAADLRTRALAGHCDARETLSPASAVLYEAVRETIQRPPSPERPLIYDDHEQALESLIEATADALARPSLLADKLDVLAAHSLD
jgi:phenylalanine ammonia-lyase